MSINEPNSILLYRYLNADPFSSVLIRGLNSLRPQRLCVEKISAALTGLGRFC